MKKKSLFTDFLVALSLSNLLFVLGKGSMGAVLFDLYYIFATSNDLHIQHSFIASIALFALVFFFLLRIDRFFGNGHPTRIGRIGFILAFLIVLHELKIQIFLNSPQVSEIQSLIAVTMPRPILVLLLLLAGILLLFFEFKRAQIVTRTARIFFLVLTPFFGMTLFYYVNQVTILNNSISLQIAYQENRVIPPAVPIAQRITPRVVWIIFDEFDYKETFESESIDSLPELNSFREKSVSTTKAEGPAIRTIESIPPLLTGKRVKVASTNGSDNLNLEFADGASGDLKNHPGLIEKAHFAKKKIAVVGSYIPLCRIFGARFKYCSNYEDLTAERIRLEHENQNSVIRYFNLIKWHSIGSLTYVPFWYRLFGDRKEYGEEVQAFKSYSETIAVARNRAEAISAHPVFDLVYIHLQIPHEPFIYDSRTKTFNGKGSYFSNLRLVDKTLSGIRKSMENSELWDTSVVIITSDHSWRKTDGGREYDPRIPFMIKMANQTESFKFDDPINTVITSDMILGIFENRIVTPEDIVKFLNENRSE
jgi:hypothetical protein